MADTHNDRSDSALSAFLANKARRYYSLRSAIIGSTLEARRAGIAQANPDTKPRSTVPAKRMADFNRLGN